MIKIYRSQVDVVLPHGTGVLNADDSNVATMAQYCDGEIIFYSLSPDSSVITTHLAEGKRAVVITQGDIMLLGAASQQKVLTLAELSLPAQPLSTETQREIMAAAAAAWALGISTETIREGLRSFK